MSFRPEETPAVARVLVVDQDEAAIDGLEVALRRAELEPVSALDGITAVKLFEELHPSAVLIGVHARGLDAKAIARDLRERSQDIPILFMGRGAPGDPIRAPSEALDAGGDYYFRLPTDLAYLAGRVRGWARSGVSAVIAPDTKHEELYALSAELDGDLDLEGMNPPAEAAIEDPSVNPTVVFSPTPALSSKDPNTQRTVWPRRPSGSIDTARALVREAESLRTAGQIDEAIEAYQAAAAIYAQDGDVRPALALYKLLIYLRPTHLELAYRGAVFAARHGEAADAVSMIERSMQALEKDGRVSEALDLADRYLSNVGPDRSVASIKRRLEGAPPADAAASHRPTPLRFPPERHEGNPWQVESSLDLLGHEAKPSDDLYPDQSEVARPATHDVLNYFDGEQTLHGDVPLPPTVAKALSSLHSLNSVPSAEQVPTLTETHEVSADLIFEEPVEASALPPLDTLHAADPQAYIDMPPPPSAVTRPARPAGAERNLAAQHQLPDVAPSEPPNLLSGASTRAEMLEAPRKPPADKNSPAGLLPKALLARPRSTPPTSSARSQALLGPPTSASQRGGLPHGGAMRPASIKATAAPEMDAELRQIVVSHDTAGQAFHFPSADDVPKTNPSDIVAAESPLQLDAPAWPDVSSTDDDPGFAAETPTPFDDAMTGGASIAPDEGLVSSNRGPASPAPDEGLAPPDRGPASLAPYEGLALPDRGPGSLVPDEGLAPPNRRPASIAHADGLPPLSQAPGVPDGWQAPALADDDDDELAFESKTEEVDISTIAGLAALAEQRASDTEEIPMLGPDIGPRSSGAPHPTSEPPPATHDTITTDAAVIEPRSGHLSSVEDSVEVLGELHSIGATGMLRGAGVELVMFDGQPVAIRSHAACETLLEEARRSHPDAANLGPSGLEPSDAPALLAQHLIANGVLSTVESVAFLHNQLEYIVGLWLRGAGPWSFEPGDILNDEALDGLPDVRRTLIDLLDDSAGLKIDQRLVVRCGRLSPDILSRRDDRFAALLDGHRTVADAARVAGLPQNRASAVLIVVLGFRLAAVIDAPVRTAAPAPPPKPSSPRGAAPRRGSSLPSFPSSSLPSDSLDALSGPDRLRALAERVRSSDYFTMLGISESAASEHVEAAHRRLRSLVPHDADPSLAREVIRSLDQARDVLKVPELRAAYLRHLRR